MPTFWIENIAFFQVFLGVALCSVSTALVGVFSVLQKRSLAGDAVAHAIFPGICIGFLLAGYKSYTALLLGAFATGGSAYLLIYFLATYSKIKKDPAVAFVLSFFWGSGVFLMSYIQKSGNAAQMGLTKFLVGHAAGLLWEDFFFFCVLAFTTIVIIKALFKEFLFVSFDPSFAKVVGRPVVAIQVILNLLTILAIVSSVQAVGIILVSALLIIPTSIARFWSLSCKALLLNVVLVAFSASFIGVLVSYSYPDLPTGPSVVLSLAFFACASFLFSPQKGLFVLYYRRYLLHCRIVEENIIKYIYEESKKDKVCSLKEVAKFLQVKERFCANRIRSLIKKSYMVIIPGPQLEYYQLTAQGEKEGLLLLAAHLSWENYLKNHFKLTEEERHLEAELVEHFAKEENSK